MKIGQVSLVLLACTSSVDAASFMAPHQASLVGHTLAHDTKEMPIVKHDKSAGDDYNKGSPLYEKQEERKAAGVASVPAPTQPKTSPDVVPVAPPSTGAYKPTLSWAFVTQGLVYAMTVVIMYVLIAAFWKHCCTMPHFAYSEESHEERDARDGWAYGLFTMDHCLTMDRHHAPVCFCAWCCGPIRIADTWSKKPFPLVKSFWVALVIVSLLGGLEYLTVGVSTVVLLCVAVYQRQKLRTKYQLPRGGSTLAYDCLSWIFCPCCTIAQEGRQVDFVVPPDAGK